MSQDTFSLSNSVSLWNRFSSCRTTCSTKVVSVVKKGLFIVSLISGGYTIYVVYHGVENEAEVSIQLVVSGIFSCFVSCISYTAGCLLACLDPTGNLQKQIKDLEKSLTDLKQVESSLKEQNKNLVEAEKSLSNELANTQKEIREVKLTFEEKTEELNLSVKTVQSSVRDGKNAVDQLTTNVSETKKINSNLDQLRQERLQALNEKKKLKTSRSIVQLTKLVEEEEKKKKGSHKKSLSMSTLPDDTT